MYYTTNPNLPLTQWQSQFGDSNRLTTISDLTPHTIYTIRVEAYTAVGPGPPSVPVQVIFNCYKNKYIVNMIVMIWNQYSMKEFIMYLNQLNFR